jgi:hypothetical protein
MDKLSAKTFEEHREYLAEIVRLKLWFVYRWLDGHPEEDLAFVLRRRVDLFRKSVFWRGQGYPTDADFKVPGWSALERQIQTLYEGTRCDADPLAFESAAFKVVWEAVEANAFRDYQASLADKGFQCDSLGYRSPVPENPREIPFHITNALQPYSIFDDKAYLPQCFFCLMDKAEAEFGVDRLSTGTWLNGHPRWLELFPKEYLDNRGPQSKDIWCGLGFWGQFVNARGTLNRKRARMFRETGRPPYHWRYSWCSFESMRAHLNIYLSQGVTPGF